MSVTLRHGLPEYLRDQAAELYWQAFGGKLGRVMGPQVRALAFLRAVIRADHAIVAIDGERLVGLAGYKTPAGSFAGGQLTDLRRHYGLLGMAWRAPLLWALGREVDNERFLVDGLCVVADLRSQGLGAALIAALCDEGRARGYRVIRLDVIDTNWRARHLYERLGFRVIRRQPLGLLRHAFGFQAALTMVKGL